MISSLLCRIAVAITITLAILTPISNASSALYVEQPEALQRIINQIDPPAPDQSGELKEATAAYFGSSFYQSLLSGNLVLASQGRMDDGSPAEYGCGLTAGALFDPMSNPIWKALIDGGQPSVVLLVKRGSSNAVSCPFDRKVFNAQQSAGGVIAVLIYDVSEMNRIRMVDRGLGSQIKIPSFFLNYHYRDRSEESKNVLENYMENITPRDAYVAEMSLEFYLPNDDGRVEMEYWYNVADDEAVPFLTSFGAPARKLGDQLLIEPRQFFSNGSARCPSEYCSKNCKRIAQSTTEQYKYYCSPSTTAPSSIFGTVNGADIVDEAIMQMCLYDLLTEGDWRDTIWMWTYWELFYSFVGPDPLQSSDWTDTKQARAKGIFTVMRMRGMPSRYSYDDVRACYMKIVKDGNITRMDNRVKEWESMGPVGRLSVYINDNEYYGTPRCPVPITHATCGILSGICYGYANNTVPDACLKNQNCPFGEDTCGGSTNIDNSVLGVSAGAVVGIVIAFLIVTGVIVWLYLRHYKQRMRADVDVLLQQYLPMDPGATHGSRNLSKVREAQEKRLISDIDLEDQALETRGL